MSLEAGAFFQRCNQDFPHFSHFPKLSLLFPGHVPFFPVVSSLGRFPIVWRPRKPCVQPPAPAVRGCGFRWLGRGKGDGDDKQVTE
jgi:hypothetical protein